MEQKARLRKLRIRSWRRGTREMDLLLGEFADRNLATLEHEEIEEFESLLDEADAQVLDMLFGRMQVNSLARIVERIQAYHGIGH